jgi:hypothetical protein
MMSDTPTVQKFRKAWPEVFPGPRIDELSGWAIRWATIQNLRSRREIPDECFDTSGRPTLVLRDPFLDWWQKWREAHRRPRVGPKPPVRRPRARAAE